MKLPLTLVLFTFSGQISAICEQAQSTVEINECLIAEIMKANTELDKAYSELIGALSASDQLLLASTQSTWLKHLEHELELIGSIWSEGTYGSIRYGYVKYEMLTARTEALKHLNAP